MKQQEKSREMNRIYNKQNLLKNFKNKKELFINQIFLAPIIIFSISTQMGAIASLVAIITIVPSAVVLHFLKNMKMFKNMGIRIGALLNIFASCLFYILAVLIANKINSSAIEHARTYLPLIVLYTFALSGSEVFTGTNNHYKPFGLRNSLLYVALLCLEIMFFSILREFLESGCIYGHNIVNFQIPGVILPCGGFILMGFYLALQEKLTRNAIEQEE